MIRLLFRFADPVARRRLAGYLVVAAAASITVSLLLIALLPLARAIFSDDPATALPWVWAIAGLGLAAGLLELVGTVLGQRAGATLILRMHEVIGARIMRLPLGWFDTERAGTISHLTARGVVFAANAPESILRSVLQAVVAPVLVSAAVVFVDPLLGGAMLLGIVLVVTVWMATRIRGQRLERIADDINHEGAARVLEFAAAQPAVRAAGPDSLAERSVRAALREQQIATERALRARSRGMALYGFLAYGVMFAVIALAVSRVLSGELDAGAFVAVLMLQIVITWFSMHGLPFGEGLDLALRTLRQIDRLLAEPLLPEPLSPTVPRDSSIEFDRVSFGYTPGVPVLRDVSFRAEPGTMTAIVGPSGSGKTTMARLIARFSDVDSGAIRIGGADVRELGTGGVMAQVSMVFQDVYLFEDSLRENIRLGRADAEDLDVERAARLAGVEEIAGRLPDGLDTQVGESGGTLSGGERQRVSIARALLKDAPIVLLDEATAALDIESEALIQRGLAELTGQKTLIVIAHRLQTIRQADQIVVLDGQGGLEAVGDHDTLLEISPSYAGFWTERSEASSWRIDAR